jgi:hypothetical protein
MNQHDILNMTAPQGPPSLSSSMLSGETSSVDRRTWSFCIGIIMYVASRGNIHDGEQSMWHRYAVKEMEMPL